MRVETDTCEGCGEMLEFCVCEHVFRGRHDDIPPFGEDEEHYLAYYEEDPEPHLPGELPGHVWDEEMGLI